MNDIKAIIAKNITELRIGKGMTQIDLAERLKYSDKAVSKWERAESLPDISVLVEIADMFGVSLDYLVREKHKEKPLEPKKPRYNKSMISGVSIALVWFIALFIFVILSLSAKELSFKWLTFIYAVPISSIVWLIFNSIWFNKRLNYFIISLLMWTALTSLHLSILPMGLNISLIYLLGIPGQIIILMWSMIRKRK